MGKLFIPLAVFSSIGLVLAGFEVFGGREKRGAPSTAFPRWTNPIPYTISDDFNATQKANIKRGIQSVMDRTCVVFQENPKVTPRLVYNPIAGNECKSLVGDSRLKFFPPANHSVRLNFGCSFAMGKIQHETSHALGIAHTFQRFDRDDYLIVNKANIVEGKEGNFEKLAPSLSPTYGIPFEYGSRMMYPAYMYAREKIPVLKPIDEGYMSSLDTAPELTFYDWKLINMHYNCSDSCSKTDPVDCQNGGYQHPKHCERCICSDFHEGDKCQIDRGLITLVPGSAPVPLTIDAIGDQQFDETYLNNWDSFVMEPLRVIKAPANSRIRITIEKQSSVGLMRPNMMYKTCYNGLLNACDRFAVQISDEDLAFAGKKYCCVDEPLSFVSKSNVIGYRAYSHKASNFTSRVTFSIEPDTAVLTTTTSTPTPSTTTTTAKPATATSTTVPTPPPTTTTTAAPTTTTTVSPTITTTTASPTTSTTTKPPTVALTTTTTTMHPSTTTTAPGPVIDSDVCEY